MLLQMVSRREGIRAHVAAVDDVETYDEWAFSPASNKNYFRSRLSSSVVTSVVVPGVFDALGRLVPQMRRDVPAAATAHLDHPARSLDDPRCRRGLVDRPPFLDCDLPRRLRRRRLRAVLYKRMSGWSSKASGGVEGRRGRGLKAWCGRRETTAKVLKDRRSPRRRGRMGTSV